MLYFDAFNQIFDQHFLVLHFAPQFNNTMTVFIGVKHSHSFNNAENDRRGIRIYDWSRSTYLTQKSFFTDPRENSACAVMKCELESRVFDSIVAIIKYLRYCIS